MKTFSQLLEESVTPDTPAGYCICGVEGPCRTLDCAFLETKHLSLRELAAREAEGEALLRAACEGLARRKF